MDGQRCMYCLDDVSQRKIKCAECIDIILCVRCFALGVEFERHKNGHAYHTISNEPFSIFKGYTTVEEEQLIEGVEQYGLGNWTDVSKHISSKTAEDCKQHYHDYYVHGTIGRYTFHEHKRKLATDHTGPPEGPLSPSITTAINAVDLTPAEQQELGYLPLRDDFEREYDNEAEGPVKDIAIEYNDEEIDIEIKVAKVNQYRTVLKERERRKRIAREHKLIQQASSLGVKKFGKDKQKFTKEQRDLKEKLKVFAQFQSLSQHNEFLDNLIKEKRIKSRIKELIKVRKAGVTKLDDISKLDSDKSKREKRESGKVKSQAISSTVSKPPTTAATKSPKDGRDIIFIDNDKDSGSSGNSSKQYKLLSPREKKLCRNISMEPENYIKIKTCIIKDYLNRQQGSPAKFRYPSHLDTTHRRRILNFLCESGWIAVAN